MRAQIAGSGHGAALAVPPHGRGAHVRCCAEKGSAGAPLPSAPTARSTGRPNFQGIPGRRGVATWAARPQSPPARRGRSSPGIVPGPRPFPRRTPGGARLRPGAPLPRPARSRCAGDGTLTPLWDGSPQPSARCGHRGVCGCGSRPFCPPPRTRPGPGRAPSFPSSRWGPRAGAGTAC